MAGSMNFEERELLRDSRLKQQHEAKLRKFEEGYYASEMEGKTQKLL